MKKQRKRLSFREEEALRALKKEFFNTSFAQEGSVCTMKCEYVDKALKMRNLEYKPDYEKLLSKMNDDGKEVFLENEDFLKGLISFIAQDLLETKENLSNQVTDKYTKIQTRFMGDSYKKVS